MNAGLLQTISSKSRGDRVIQEKYIYFLHFNIINLCSVALNKPLQLHTYQITGSYCPGTNAVTIPLNFFLFFFLSFFLKKVNVIVCIAFPAKVMFDLCPCLRRTEECDDGNLLDRDGCSKKCSMEPGFNCLGE